jgi:hypothetical protein
MPEPSAEPYRQVGRIFGTPLVVQGLTWLPLSQLVAWLVMVRRLAVRRPDLKPTRRLATAALCSAVLLGSEWCHNLAHAFAASAVGRPMDEMRIILGMPRCFYRQLNDPSVSPRLHILRSLGGPLFNILLLPLIFVLRRRAKPGSAAREVADTAWATNLFLSTNSFLPIPGLDGGALLKWGLVERGLEIDQADEAVRKVNGLLALLLALASGLAFKRRRGFFGFFAALLSLSALGVFTGRIREERAPF